MIIVYNINTREQVIALLSQAAGGNVNLDEIYIQHPLVQTIPRWPTERELSSLPLAIQCEELEYKDGKFNSKRALIIDIQYEPKSNQTNTVQESGGPPEGVGQGSVDSQQCSTT